MMIESSDRDRGTVVLLAESKLDGAPLGTMRIQTNAYGPLAVEQSVHLPDHLAMSRLAEATRLGVAGGMVGRVVKVALCKALWMFCELHGIDYMVITARSPLDREHEAMLFKDISASMSSCRCRTSAACRIACWRKTSPRRASAGRKPVIRSSTTWCTRIIRTSICIL